MCFFIFGVGKFHEDDDGVEKGFGTLEKGEKKKEGELVLPD